MATTAGTIADRVLRRLEESTTAPVFWDRTEILDFINEGLNELNLIALKIRTTGNEALSASTFYSSPTGSVAILQVGVSNRPLHKETLENLDRQNKNWQDDRGIPRQWSPVGLNLFAVHPSPTSGATANIIYLDTPSALGENDDIPLEDEFCEALEDYAFHMARFKEAGDEFAQSTLIYERFLDKVRLISGQEVDFDHELLEGIRQGTGVSYEEERG